MFAPTFLFRNQWLRYRLVRDYPEQLKFHQSSDHKLSDLVTATDALLSEIVHDTQITTDHQITSESEAYSSTGSSPLRLTIGPVHTPQKRTELYHAALGIRTAISNQAVHISHPPDLHELSLENAQSIVPPHLFNFICLATGLSDEVPDSDAYLNVDNPSKVLSICQDIIGLSGKLTPKSVALGLTVRHATTSKYLLDLLHGLGHTYSYASVLKAETALAYQQARSLTDFIPEGFELGKLFTLVYDNIDFLEETLSGSGTSHYTNGIMFQVKPDGSNISVQKKVKIAKSKKTYTPTKDDISAYHLFKKDCPQYTIVPPVDLHLLEESKDLDLNYILTKLSAQSMPSTWTGANIVISTPLPASNLHYLPIIEASPTEYATVKHVLTEATKMVEQMQCPAAVVVFDQAIYCKAQMIRWTDEELRKRLVIRLGEFHTILAFLGTIGKRFEKSGLEDVLVEAEIVSVGSMKGVTSGHMYNRSVRAHKLLFEALTTLQLKEFLACCDEQTKEIASSTIEDLVGKLVAGVDLSTDKEFHKAFLNHVQNRCKSSSLYQFWNSYLQMVSTLLAFIRGTRTGNFDLHISALRDMLPYFFAYDRVNYSRYGPKVICI